MFPDLSSLALAALLAGAPGEDPGRCMPPPSVATARDNAAAVFVGRVVRQRDTIRVMRQEATNHTYQIRDIEHVFAIDASWKLPAGVSDTLRVWTHDGSEEPVIRMGERWLIYAGESRFLPGRLFAFGCGRTNPAHRAAEDFSALGPPSSGTVPPRSPNPR